MWTGDLIAQAIGWGALIAGFPFIFIYVKKITTYLAYAFYPRDMLIQYKDSNNETKSYVLKHTAFKGSTLKRVPEAEARAIGGKL